MDKNIARDLLVKALDDMEAKALEMPHQQTAEIPTEKKSWEN